MIGTRLLVSMLLAGATLAGCGASGEPARGTKTNGEAGIVAPQPPERLRAQVLETLPHDTNAFTQGYEIAHGVLYESTGRVGKSWVRAVDTTTGEELARVALPPPLFGEGITVVEDSLWQVTWQNGIAIRRDADTLAERERVEYSGEGWGLCHQAEEERLVMSDGSGTLTFRDPETFTETGSVRVRSGGERVDRLNELECVNGTVYANVWQTDTILRIDVGEGTVTGEIDASGLLEPSEQATADVLNGIAAIPGSEYFFLTGKLWPKTFRVRFVPQQ
ncbi:glutaminyl-peptide cyclotransferase [Haloechinothrix salitolerans]|uniref:Glutaminyl-peptide cyclotransferase n=1 Tax=Haloechinothrix salitolerans TaxID=926830 RepID=A0ABW2BVS9_9PSEU